MCRPSSIVCIALTLLTCSSVSSASAQTPTVLLKEDDLLANGLLRVTRILRNDVNRVGGYMSFVVTRAPSGNKVSLAWGSRDALKAPQILLKEGTYQGVPQTTWNIPGSFDDQGRVGYRATSPSVNGGVEGAWHQDVPVALEAPLGPWSVLDAVGVTDSGVMWVDDSATGLFLDPTQPPLYQRDQTIPDTNEMFLIADSVAFSSDAAHHLVALRAYSGTRYLVLDEASLFAQGFQLQTNAPVPPVLGGNGLNVWSDFGDLDVNANGDWCVSARSPSTLIRNGQLAYRFLDVVDGFTLNGFQGGALGEGELDLSDRGELLHVWTDTSFQSQLFVDDDRVTGSGVPVDLDGDGVAEPWSGLIGVANYASLSEDGWVYFSGTVDIDPGPFTDARQAFLRVPRSPAPIVYCTAKASSSGCLGSLQASDPTLAPVSGAGGYSLFATGLEGQRSGLYFWSTSGRAALPFQGGTLCVQPPIGRTALRPTGGTAGTCDGSLALGFNAATVPWDFGPGQTTWWQVWLRDPDLNDGFDAALSNAIEVKSR